MTADAPISWNLPLHYVSQCRSRSDKFRMADSTGASLKGGDLLLRTQILRIVLRRLIDAEQSRVAVLLPPTVPGAVVNFALALDGITSVNLNYSATESILNRCIENAGVKTVITSRKFMEKFGFQLNANVIYLEDLKGKIDWTAKAKGFMQAKLLPMSMLIRTRDGHKRSTEDAVTVIFTSGSTGDPKGVVLSYGNIASNIGSMRTALSLTEKDTIVGILPFFHSFGYTICLWAPMVLPLSAVYHYNPLDAKQIGKLTKQYAATILLSTPTFLRTFLRRVEPDQFKSLELVVVGAEKQPLSLSDAFEERFGVRPIEGYGMTEMGPLVSVNVPPSRNTSADKNDALCEGSVGKPLPDIDIKVVSLDDGSTLGTDQDGMLFVRGPGLMKGYLRPDGSVESPTEDGWYKTGDVCHFDAAGFIHVTGRQSRFSKIGGEMVPHLKIEQAIHELIGETNEDGTISAVVTAVPDEKRGERIVVLYHSMSKSPEAVVQGLGKTDMPKLYLPSEDSFVQVDQIPILGTGKLDLKAIQEQALEKFSVD